MPIYEYACQACERRFELKQSVNDPPLSTCERCGGDVTKLISAPAIMFKGSGWYVTDYSDKLKPPPSRSEQAPADAKPDQDGKQQDGKKAAPAADGGGSASSTATPSTSGNGDKSGDKSGGKSGGSSSSSSPASSGSAAPSST